MAKRKNRTRRRQSRGGQQPPEELRGLRFGSQLEVKFADGSVANGSLKQRTATEQEPTIYWEQPPGDAFRTLLVFDPDAPARSWLHWLVVNATGETARSGETFMPWAPPTPPSGVHRYYFCLFDHDVKIPVKRIVDGVEVGVIGSSAQHYELGPIALGLVKSKTEVLLNVAVDEIPGTIQEVVVAQ